MPKYEPAAQVMLPEPNKVWISELTQLLLASSVAPLATEIAPVPELFQLGNALVLLTTNAPVFTVVPPVQVLEAPDKYRIPLPLLVRLLPDPLMLPPMVSVPADTVTMRLAPKVTAPVPMLKSLVPVKVKSPFQF